MVTVIPWSGSDLCAHVVGESPAWPRLIISVNHYKYKYYLAQITAGSRLFSFHPHTTRGFWRFQNTLKAGLCLLCPLLHPLFSSTSSPNRRASMFLSTAISLTTIFISSAWAQFDTAHCPSGFDWVRGRSNCFFKHKCGC